MKKINLLSTCLITFVISVFSIVHAQSTITVTITSDNAYVFGFGDVNGIFPTNYYSPGVCNIYASDIYSSGPNGAESYQINNSNINGYIYIAAWSDNQTFQGLIAQFTNGTSTIVTGSNPSNANPNVTWEVFATGIDLNSQPGNPNCPNLSGINNQISAANTMLGGTGSSKGWVKEPQYTAYNSGKNGVLAIGPSNITGNPFPPGFASGIASTAHWMWYFHYSPIPTLNQPFIFPAPPGEYYIFRIGPIGSLFPTSNHVCCPELPNLIKNSAFDQPLAKGTSQYILDGSPDANSCLPGEYTLISGARANIICPQWVVQDHSECVYNTSPTNIGHFMVVNGETTQPSNINNIIWQQTVTGIEIDSTYKFCVYMKNLPACCFDVIPKGQIEFIPGGIIPWTTDNTGSGACDWQLVDHTFRATSTSVTIKISLEETTKGDGNDLAIDDISLTKIPQVPKQYTIFSLNPFNSTSTSPIYNIEVSSTILNWDGFGNWWSICGLDENNNVLYEIRNPELWWNTNPLRFKGFNSTSTFPAGTSDGIFYADKRYRITYGVWSTCYSWNSRSYDIKPGKGNKPVIQESTSVKISPETIDKTVNTKGQPIKTNIK